MLDIKCDFCGSKLESIYKPVGTKRGAEIYICVSCALVQTLFDANADYSREISVSCDADWGNVRYGKRMRLAANMELMEKHINIRSMTKVLDIGSNRGDFVRFIRENFPHISVIAIEPDHRIIDYEDVGIEVINDRIENVSASLDSGFDLVYCVHTLEHVMSASFVIDSIYDLLLDEGVCLLEVPNLRGVLSFMDNVEEFFIDKHTFHFTPEVLDRFLRASGFAILAKNIDSSNITFLIRKQKKLRRQSYEELKPDRDEYSEVKNLISRYSRILSNNRRFLKLLVSDYLSQFFERQKVGFWGAGRIFDAFMKYGELEKEWIYVLVDKYLSSIVDNIRNIPLLDPQYLKVYDPQVVFVLSRSGADAICSEACNMGFGKMVTFPELMEQAFVRYCDRVYG